MRPRLGVTALLAGALVLSGATVIPAAGAVPLCAGKRVTILGTGGDDVIRGTSGDDVIDGRAGSDVITGRQGDDTICGNYGADDLRGSSGDDRLYGGPDAIFSNGAEAWFKKGDTLRGGSGDDTLVPGVDARGGWNVDPQPDRLRYDAAPRGVRVDLVTGRATGEGTDRIAVNGPVEAWTTPFADEVVGSPYDDLIRSGAGSDRVWGADGRDVIIVDTDTDTDTDTDAGADRVWGGPGPDRIYGGGGDDRLVGGTGDDWIRDSGQRSSDTLEGGSDDDELDDAGESGAGRMHGQDGDDLVWVRRPDDAMHTGGPGVDSVRFWLLQSASYAQLDLKSGTFAPGGETPSVALGGFEIHQYWAGPPLRVTGSPGDDHVSSEAPVTMEGHGGDDSLFGSERADTFDGGLGSDCFGRRQSTGEPDTLVDVESVRTLPELCPSP